MLEAGETRHSNKRDQDSARVTGIFELDDLSESRHDLNHPLLPKELPGIPGKQPGHVVGPITKSAGPDESKV